MIDTFTLGLNTTVVGMGIVFLVLISLWVLIALQSRVIGALGGLFEKPHENELMPVNTIPASKSGSAEGMLQVDGKLDDETLAAVLSAVSEYTEIPLDELSVKSIREIA